MPGLGSYVDTAGVPRPVIGVHLAGDGAVPIIPGSAADTAATVTSNSTPADPVVIGTVAQNADGSFTLSGNSSGINIDTLGAGSVTVHLTAAVATQLSWSNDKTAFVNGAFYAIGNTGTTAESTGTVTAGLYVSNAYARYLRIQVTTIGTTTAYVTLNKSSISNRGNSVTVSGTATVVASSADNSSLASGLAVMSRMSSVVGGMTAGTNGSMRHIQSDLAGRVIVKPGGNAQSHTYGRQTITATTEVNLFAAVANTRFDVQKITIANRDNVSHTLDFRDTTAGTIRETVIVEAGKTWQLVFPMGMPNSAVNTNWTVSMRETATTAVEINGSAYAVTGG